MRPGRLGGNNQISRPVGLSRTVASATLYEAFLYQKPHTTTTSVVTLVQKKPAPLTEALGDSDPLREGTEQMNLLRSVPLAVRFRTLGVQKALMFSAGTAFVHA